MSAMTVENSVQQTARTGGQSPKRQCELAGASQLSLNVYVSNAYESSEQHRREECGQSTKLATPAAKILQSLQDVQGGQSQTKPCIQLSVRLTGAVVRSWVPQFINSS
jgi:hypothetical protein